MFFFVSGQFQELSSVCGGGNLQVGAREHFEGQSAAREIQSEWHAMAFFLLTAVPIFQKRGNHT
jgi:hypothetical protein